MNCERWREDLTFYVDGSLDEAKVVALQEHLLVCAACREEHKRLKQLESLFDSWSEVEYSDQQSFAQLRNAAWLAARSSQPRVLPLWVSVAALAACALFFVYLAGQFRALQNDWQQILQSQSTSQSDTEHPRISDSIPAVEHPANAAKAPIRVVDVIAVDGQSLALVESLADDRRYFMKPGSTVQGCRLEAALPEGLRFTAPGGETMTLAFADTVDTSPTRGERKLFVVERSLLDALTWLQRHQGPDGFWEVENFNWLCECDGEGVVVEADLGVTGLALLAFARAGYDQTGGTEYSESIRRGIQAVLKRQVSKDVDYQGLFIDADAFGDDAGLAHYTHAVLTTALAELLRLSGDESLRAPVEQAVAYIAKAQNANPRDASRKTGWGHAPKSGASDTLTTAWMAQALASAQAAGIAPPAGAAQGALAFLDDMTSRATWRTGYTEQGRGTPALPEDKIRWIDSEVTTALAVHARLALGSRRNDAVTRKGLDLIVGNLPVYWFESGVGRNRAGLGVTASSVDFHAWMVGTLAVSEAGSGSEWIRWERAMLDALPPHQVTGGNDCARGSWDPSPDRWSRLGGRVFATAVNAVTLSEMARRRLSNGSGDMEE